MDALLSEGCQSCLQNGALGAQSSEFPPALELWGSVSWVQIGAVPAEGTILRRASVYWAVSLEQDLDFLYAVSQLQFIGS